jgi:hypothetical protein
VLRFLAPAALLLVAAAIVVAAAGPLDDDPEDRTAGARQPAVPTLREPEQVRPAAGRPEPLGLYPALSTQRGLALPSTRAIDQARRFAASREGNVSFALLGGGGRIIGRGVNEQYESASLVKAMILVAFLRDLAAADREPSDLELTRMGDMIRTSDNFSASEVYSWLSPGAMDELAAEAGMRSFEFSEFWGNCVVTAADQVRFFLSLDRLLPAAYRDFARELLENIVSFHAWGIPEAARPEWRVLFKGGWRPDADQGEIVHQAALLERGSHKLALAVLSDEDPSETYGHDTIRGIAERLLEPGVEPGILVPVQALQGYEAPRSKALRPST